MLVHHRLEAVVGGHRGQRGVVGRGDGTVHGRRGAVVGQLRGALSGHHALQHVEGRLVCLVGETRGQRALQRGDAASAAACPSVVARAAAVARGAIAGASALLSSFEASSAVTRSSRAWMAAAGGCRVHRQVSHLSVGSQSEGQLSCCDVRAVSHLSVVQDLRDVARDRSFKHVFLGVVVTRIRNAGLLYFRSAPYLYAK